MSNELVMDHFVPPLVFSPYTYLPTLGTIAVVIALWFKRRRDYKGQESDPPSFLPTLATAFWLVWALWSVAYPDTMYNFYLPALYHSQWLGLVVACIAITLYFLRKEARWFYALLEIIGASLAIYVTTIPSDLPFAQRAVAIVGAVYFLIRGLDNADQGKLWKKIWTTFATSPRLAVVVILFSALGTAAGMFVEKSDRLQHPMPDLPAGAYTHDLWRPVSAIKCGQPFVSCSKENWIERERLLAGTPKERATAELEADRRFDAYLIRYPHPVASPTFAVRPK